MQLGELKSHRQVDTQQLLCLWLTFLTEDGKFLKKPQTYYDRDKDEIRHRQPTVKYSSVRDNYSQTKHWKKDLLRSLCTVAGHHHITLPHEKRVDQLSVSPIMGQRSTEPPRFCGDRAGDRLAGGCGVQRL